MTWLDLYEQARTREDAAAGYYNHNIRVDTATGPVIVRIPIHGADVMDLRLWREEHVLPAIAPYVDNAPRLLHISADPAFQIHEFMPGDVLNDIAPRGVRVPSHVPGDIVWLFTQLIRAPSDQLPPVPGDWPADGDSDGFGRRLAALTQWVYETYADEYAELFTAFAIPADPLAHINRRWPRLTPRPYACVHADVHRKNMIINDGSSGFLDWELALWGDPVYDLAVHFHKMGYQPDERDAVLKLWVAEMPAERTAGWEHDLDVYLAHERIKSAIVDTVRYAQIFVQDGPYPYPPSTMIEMMTAKINAARKPWKIPEPIDLKTVSDVFARRAARQRTYDGR